VNIVNCLSKFLWCAFKYIARARCAFYWYCIFYLVLYFVLSISYSITLHVRLIYVIKHLLTYSLTYSLTYLLTYLLRNALKCLAVGFLTDILESLQGMSLMRWCCCSVRESWLLSSSECLLCFLYRKIVFVLLSWRKRSFDAVYPSVSIVMSFKLCFVSFC